LFRFFIIGKEAKYCFLVEHCSQIAVFSAKQHKRGQKNSPLQEKFKLAKCGRKEAGKYFYDYLDDEL
jgi:hypothetical protein